MPDEERHAFQTVQSQADRKFQSFSKKRKWIARICNTFWEEHPTPTSLRDISFHSRVIYLFVWHRIRFIKTKFEMTTNVNISHVISIINICYSVNFNTFHIPCLKNRIMHRYCSLLNHINAAVTVLSLLTT